MRIIAGSARGRTIVAPKGQQTRPTQDFVRESLFNIIQRDVPGTNVLDLFAGSGALAMEALSRGASHAVLVDKARLATDCIRRNADTLGFLETAEIKQGDWRSVLGRLNRQKFDLVFLDPPYRLTIFQEITQLLADYQYLADEALIVIEHHKNTKIELSPAFLLANQRAYGDTLIHFYRFCEGGSADGK